MGNLIQNADCLGYHPLSDGCQRNAPAPTLEQLRTKLLFQLGDRDRQRGLADEHLFRRLAKISVTGNGHDVTKFCKSHEGTCDVRY